MIVGAVQITIYAPWVHSLKEKRMVVKSLSAKTKNKFNVSVAEVEDQDLHQRIVLGIACVVSEASVANSMIDNVLNFVESNTEGEIIDIERELR
ncbi:DUF503 family protein [Acetobacterium fimetarium]|uniref:DUF503 family protein n=1 Tax=Acetobacterium fimetarium TaxID=52691 RepID=A0ABR6WYG4_9FIRM|nr:DUF503 domain-containing protein [Acetobacterium fimetarium]MBC3805644.1 DUF503 family protein [Acetobacterium fimetarium]